MTAYHYLGTTDERDTCDSCGRTNLKRTVALQPPAGPAVFFGTSCAARSLRIPARDVRVQIRATLKAEKAAAMAARSAVHRAAADARAAEWRAFLDAHAPAGHIADQIAHLGGYAAARALQKADAAA